MIIIIRIYGSLKTIFLEPFLIESEVNELEQFYQLGWTLDSAGGASGEAYMVNKMDKSYFKA